MTDSEQVEIRKDEGLESFGKNPYLLAQKSFDHRGYRASMTVMLVLVLVITTVMLLSKKIDQHRENAAKQRLMPQPTLDAQGAPINPRFLTNQDLQSPGVLARLSRYIPNGIRVLNLGKTTDLPPGSEMAAILVSGASDGIVKAKLTEPLMVDGETVAPENSLLFGKGHSGEERLFVEFTRLRLPDGATLSFSAQGFDGEDKIQGLKGETISAKAQKTAGALAFGFVGGVAQGFQTTDSYFMPTRPSARDAALNGASKAALDQSQAYMDEMKHAHPVIVVKAGTTISGHR